MKWACAHTQTQAWGINTSTTYPHCFSSSHITTLLQKHFVRFSMIHQTLLQINSRSYIKHLTLIHQKQITVDWTEFSELCILIRNNCCSNANVFVIIALEVSRLRLVTCTQIGTDTKSTMDTERDSMLWATWRVASSNPQILLHWLLGHHINYL